MATYSRIYTSKTTNTADTISWKNQPFTSAVLSGDNFNKSGATEKTISKVTSVTLKIYLNITTSQSMNYVLTLLDSEGTAFGISYTTTKSLSEGYHTVSLSIPSSTFENATNVLSNDNFKVKLNMSPTYRNDDATYKDIKAHPVTIIVEFESQEILPIINNLVLERCDNNGAINNEGEHIKLSCVLSANLYGSYSLICNKENETTTYTIVSSDSFTAPVAISTVIPNLTLEKEAEATYIVTFTAQYGDLASETYTSTGTIKGLFVNMHLSAARQGGVSFGKFSTADDENPKFECEYPAYFSNGIYVGSVPYTLNIEAGTLLFGHLTTSSTEIVLSLPVPYLSPNVTSASITKIKGNIRCAGKYGLTSSFISGGTDYIKCVTSILISYSTNTLIITLKKASGTFYGTNNYPADFSVNELEITLS